MAPHSSTLAWQIPWTEEPGRLKTMGLLSWTRLSDFTFTFHFHALEKEMATHSSVLAWRIPGAGEPGGPPSMGSHRVGHDWNDLAAAAHFLIEVFFFFYILSYMSPLYVFFADKGPYSQSYGFSRSYMLEMFSKWSWQNRTDNQKWLGQGSFHFCRRVCCR